ncbi:MAG: hypothetical protein CMF62_03400 [Magnetococcales bacterium]|nr:hypothetical protein [Magnetococcales bacterium]|tara:strand:+ start:20572 stop:21027 length:456 start_codon:yes stop_codon:yes gene_type:complete
MNNYELIILSDHSDDYKIPDKQAPWDENINIDSEDSEYYLENEIFDDGKKDDKINNFINFCLKNHLFNDSFYDYRNIFSVVATNLPETFAKISKGDRIVKKDKFKVAFQKQYKFTGDIDYIYNNIDKENKGYITWEKFKNFFLPYVKNVSM